MALPFSTDWAYLYLPCLPDTINGVPFTVVYPEFVPVGAPAYSADKIALGVDTVKFVVVSPTVGAITSNSGFSLPSLGVKVGDWIEFLAPSPNAGIYQITELFGSTSAYIDLVNTPWTTGVFANENPVANCRINPFTITVESAGGGAPISAVELDVSATALAPPITFEAYMRVEQAPVGLSSFADASLSGGQYLGVRAELWGSTGIGLLASKTMMGWERDDYYYDTIDDSAGYVLETTEEGSWTEVRIGGDTGMTPMSSIFDEGGAYWQASGGETFRHYAAPRVESGLAKVVSLKVSAIGTPERPVKSVIKSLKGKGTVDLHGVAPVVVAPPSRATITGRTETISLEDSYDTDGGSLKGQWRLIEAPDDSDYTLSLRDCFTTDDGDGDPYTYQLEHADFGAAPDPTKPATNVVVGTVIVINNNTFIVASIAPGVLDLAVLDLSEVNPLVWAYVGTVPQADELPINTTDISCKAYLQDFDSVEYSPPVAYLTTDVTGTYVLAGWVADMEYFSQPAQVVIEARELETLLGETVNGDFLWKYLSDAWSQISEKEYFTEYFSGLVQMAGNQLTKLWQVEKNESLQDIQPYFLYRWLEADHRVPDDDFDEQEWTSSIVPIVMAPAAGAHTGATLEVQYPQGDPDDLGSLTTHTLTVTTATNEVDAVEDLVDQLNALGYGTYSITWETHLGSSWYSIITDAQTIFSGGTALGVIFPAAYSYIPMGAGYVLTRKRFVITDASFMEFALDGHFLVVGGESYTIERFIEDPNTSSKTGFVYCIVVVKEDLPQPYANYYTWSIPPFLTSDSVNWENELVFSLDPVQLSLVKGDDYTEDTCYVVGAQDNKLGFLHDMTGGVVDFPPENPWWDEWSVTRVDRQRYFPVDEDVWRMPRLQETIDLGAAAVAPDDYLIEGVQYALRDFRGRHAVMHDHLHPPDFTASALDSAHTLRDTVAPRMWAEHVYVDQKEHISNSFGVSVDFEENDVDHMEVLEYLSAVRGLWFIFTRGRTLENLSIGLNIFCSLPVNDTAGTITSIQDNAALQNDRIEITDAGGSKKYYLVSKELGVANNTDTGVPWAIGDSVPRFSILSNGVETADWIQDPDWFDRIKANPGALLYEEKFWETQKYHTFQAGIPAGNYSAEFIQKIYDFIMAYRPMHLFMGEEGFYAWKQFSDDVEPQCEIEGFEITLRLHDQLCGISALMYDSGHHVYDPAPGIYDQGALDICPDEHIEVDLSYTFTGRPQYDTILVYDYVFTPPLPGP